MYNRAEEFKKNVDFNEVKNKIYNQLSESYILEKDRIIGLPSDINYIREKYPQTYNFIKSVENNQNDIQDYYSEK